MTDPTILRHSAAELRTQAEAALAILDDVTRFSTRTEVWAGPVADRFDVELGERRADLRIAAEELRTVAADLDHRARAIEVARAQAEARARAAAGQSAPRRAPTRHGVLP